MIYLLFCYYYCVLLLVVVVVAAVDVVVIVNYLSIYLFIYLLLPFYHFFFNQLLSILSCHPIYFYINFFPIYFLKNYYNFFLIKRQNSINCYISITQILSDTLAGIDLRATPPQAGAHNIRLQTCLQHTPIIKACAQKLMLCFVFSKILKFGYLERCNSCLSGFNLNRKIKGKF